MYVTSLHVVRIEWKIFNERLVHRIMTYYALSMTFVDNEFFLRVIYLLRIIKNVRIEAES